MKKVLLILILAFAVVWMGCELKTPETPKLNLTQGQLALNKIVAVGNSLTAGYQSAGLRRDFQEHSYPYLIAKQLGKADEFEMPWIEAPGIGSTELTDPNYVAGPLEMTAEGPKVLDSTLITQVPTLLSNALLPRPYDNLAVPGADLNDALNTLTSEGNGNAFFDIVLRNPNLGNTSMIQQAIMLNPTLIFLWLGNNDVLGAALNGGDLDAITSQSDFQSRLNSVLSQLRSNTSAFIVMGNVPYVTDIPFVNTLDGIFVDFGALGKLPVMFDSNFQPIDFDPSDGVLYLPLQTAETNVEHITLPYLSIYSETGIGIPDSADIADFLQLLGQDQATAAATAQQLVLGIKANGLNPTGIPMPGNLTITTDEAQSIKDAIDGFNATIAQLAQTYQVAVFNANAMLTQLNESGIDGYTGKYVLLDPVNTAFSLDGVHPNNAGYAIVANQFIGILNQALGLNIPSIDTDQYRGQYAQALSSRKELRRLSFRALEGVKSIFIRESKN